MDISTQFELLIVEADEALKDWFREPEDRYLERKYRAASKAVLSLSTTYNRERLAQDLNHSA